MLTKEEEEALAEILEEASVRENRTTEMWEAIINGDLAELQGMMK